MCSYMLDTCHAVCSYSYITTLYREGYNINSGKNAAFTRFIASYILDSYLSIAIYNSTIERGLAIECLVQVQPLLAMTFQLVKCFPVYSIWKPSTKSNHVCS